MYCTYEWYQFAQIWLLSHGLKGRCDNATVKHPGTWYAANYHGFWFLNAFTLIYTCLYYNVLVLQGKFEVVVSSLRWIHTSWLAWLLCIDVRRWEVLSMVLLRLEAHLELSVKRRDFLPRFGSQYDLSRWKRRKKQYLSYFFFHCREGKIR